MSDSDYEMDQATSKQSNKRVMCIKICPSIKKLHNTQHEENIIQTIGRGKDNMKDTDQTKVSTQHQLCELAT